MIPNPSLTSAQGAREAPSRYQAQLAARAALLLGQQEALARWRATPWLWFQERCTLLDPLAPPGQQIAPYPNFAYCKALIDALGASNVVAGWKSRRMIFSWSGIAWAVMLCELFENQRCYFISRKEGETDGEGARELVWRAGWMARALRGGPPPEVEVGKLHILFKKTGSTITGVSSNPEQMRQVSANYVMLDEFGFHERPRELYTSLKPTLEGRGKLFVVSSSAEGFFKEIVLDIEEEGGRPPLGHPYAIPGRGLVPPASLRLADAQDAERFDDDIEMSGDTQTGSAAEPVPFAVWRNKSNKFLVVAAHYLADPRKSNPEWLAREKAGCTRSVWLREYEMQWNVHAGRPVYLHDWRPDQMVRPRLKIERERPVWASLDFGYHWPAMLCGQMRYGTQCLVLRAFQGQDMQFEEFFRQALVYLAQWFPKRDLDPEARDFIWCADCAGDTETSVGLAEVRVMRKKFGIHPKLKKGRISPRIDLVRKFMCSTYRGEPCFLVDQNPTLALFIAGLDGGYAYPVERRAGQNEIKPIKDDVHDHLQNCLEYAVLNFGPRMHSENELRRAARADIFEMPRYIT